MKPRNHITAEDWNSLTRDQQLRFRDCLRFMGYPVLDSYYPAENIRSVYVVYLYRSGQLSAMFNGHIEGSTRYTLQELLSLIELLPC